MEQMEVARFHNPDMMTSVDSFFREKNIEKRYAEEVDRFNSSLYI
jgi:hypothetical protein